MEKVITTGRATRCLRNWFSAIQCPNEVAVVRGEPPDTLNQMSGNTMAELKCAYYDASLFPFDEYTVFVSGRTGAVVINLAIGIAPEHRKYIVGFNKRATAPDLSNGCPKCDQ